MSMPTPSTPSTPTPADVVRTLSTEASRLISLSADPDPALDPARREDQLDRLAALYAEKTDVRHPFAPLGDTPHLSRAEVRAHFGGTRVPAESLSAVDMHVHETDDPEVVVAEFRYEGTCEGRPFSWPCIFVTRVRDGLIVESRDYADHIGAARAFGGLDALAAALVAHTRA